MRQFLDIPVCLRILRLAGPLILSMTGILLMQITDGLFLSWYSADALAAVGPAGMAAFVVTAILMGAAGYTSTLAAHYTGAKQPEKIGAAVWQGIYFALISGGVAALLAPAGPLLFRLVGHTPLVQQYESTYFAIMCYGMPVSLLAAAVSGFFSGRGSNFPLMIFQLTGLAVNGLLAYGLIFGRWGLPELGVAGAGWATVASQALVAVLLAWRFLRRRSRADYGTWRGRAWNPEMMSRLIRFGLPAGARFSTEILAWTFFLFFVGRLGTDALAATNVAWRLNGVAFFPIIGLSEAIRTLVGQAQGRGCPEESTHVTVQGVLLAEVWMLAAGLAFLLWPRELYHFFQGSDTGAAEAFAPIVDTGVVLLRFVAIYCLLDALNIIFAGVLQAAGDTRWTLWMSLVMHAAFLLLLTVADGLRLGLYAEWTVATVFVMSIALVWLWRFHGGAWKHIKVIGPPAGADY